MPLDLKDMVSGSICKLIQLVHPMMSMSAQWELNWENLITTKLIQMNFMDYVFSTVLFQELTHVNLLFMILLIKQIPSITIL
jgi:hypothetical protein